MRYDVMLHVGAGLVSLASGFAALYVTKGAPMHRRVGMVFVYAMLTMGLSGATITIVKNIALASNVSAGLLTTYLVLTSLFAVRPPTRATRLIDVALLLLVAGITTACLTFGFEAVANGGRRRGIPAFPFFLFATAGLFAVIGDYRVLKNGPLRGAPRIVRHLWRMSFALFIAAMSFFLGQAKVFPKPLRIYPMLMIPPLIVLIAMFYWMWRLRRKRAARGMASLRVAGAT